jgi:hypothetical protein
MKSGAFKVADNLAKLTAGINMLTRQQVMVGVPASKTDRDGPITNAALAYIHDNGAPESGIPARPFMVPGVKRKQAETAALLRKAGEYALDGNVEAVDRQLHSVGLLNQASIRGVISEGIPPPIKWATALGRIRRREGKSYRKKKRAELDANAAYLPGDQASTGIFTPLIDTAQLLKSITYVIRKKP